MNASKPLDIHLLDHCHGIPAIVDKRPCPLHTITPLRESAVILPDPDMLQINRVT